MYDNILQRYAFVSLVIFTNGYVSFNGNENEAK